MGVQERDIRGRYDADPARSFTLPSWLYTDAAVFETEKAAIFGRAWQCVAPTEELRAPGDALRSLRRLVSNGRLKPHRFGKSYTYRRDDVLKLIREEPAHDES